MSDDQIFKNPWPEPEPLVRKQPPVLEFQPELLPVSLRTYAVDCAERMNCPLDFVAMPLVCTAGSVIGRQLAVRPKLRDNWEVIPNLWGAIIGTPSSRKSPAAGSALVPLMALDAQAKVGHREAMRLFESEKMVYELAVKSSRKQAANKLQKDSSELGRRNALVDIEAVTNASPEEPNRRVFVTQDATCEKLGELLRKNEYGFLVCRDELTGWMSEFDKAGRESSRSFYLQAWNGDGPYRVDRIGRGSIEVPALCLSVFGGIQPDKLRGYFRSVLNGNADDGLLARFQLMVWPDPVRIERIDRQPDRAAREKVIELYTWLANLPVTELGAVENTERIPYLRFSESAAERFALWEAELRMRAAKESPAMESHLCKYASLVPSLAVIFHIVEHQSGAVSVKAVDLALRWVAYLESHARRVYAPLLAPEMESAINLGDKIKAGKLANSFTYRDVYRNEWSGLTNLTQVRAAVEVLLEHQWLAVTECEPTGKIGRNPGPLFTINPKIRL